MKTRGILREYASTFALLFRLFDMFVVLASGMVVYLWYIDRWPLTIQYQAALMVAVLLVPLTFSSVGIYRSWRGGSTIAELRGVSLGLATVFVMLVILSFTTKTSALYSRVWFAGWALSAWFGLISIRLVVRLILREIRASGCAPV